MQKWISSVNVRIRPDVKISALPDVLDHQLQAFEDVRSEIFQKEPALRSLVGHGKELSSKAPSHLSSSIQARLEAVQDGWQDINKRAADRTPCCKTRKNESRDTKRRPESFCRGWPRRKWSSEASHPSVSERYAEEFNGQTN